MVYVQSFVRYLLPGSAASIFFLAIFEFGLRIKKEKVTWFHRMMVLSMGLYLTSVFALTVSPGNGFSMGQFDNEINWVPLKVLDTVSGNPLNFWGNIILFVPFGILLVMLSNKYQRFYITLFAGAKLSLLIELLQLFSIRSTDIDDIILNTAGTFCGFLTGKLILSLVPSLRKSIGVIKKKDGYYRRKYNDTGSIAVLTMLILLSIFIADFSGMNNEARISQIAAENNPASLIQPSRRYDTVDISGEIKAKNAYLWNTSSNTILYEKESDKRIAPASTAKMLTALTVLDYCDDDDTVLVGEEIQLIAKDASRAFLYPGTSLTVCQLLDALLLPSGNDAAYALAVFAGKRICGKDSISTEEALEAFVRAMNKKAADVGAVDSSFKNPDGYDTYEQYTTAHDLACIAKAFWESSLLRDIAGSYRVSDVWLSGQEVTYYNTNELINPDSQYYFKGAAGLKTGNSEAAGGCLVSAAYIADELYLCVVMGSTEEGRWTDSLILYNAIEQ